MKKFKPQHSRLLFIDKKIRAGEYPNCTSLGLEWEVSSKTIQRDLDYLRNTLDAPLAYHARERGYYYTEDSYQLSAMALNDSDLFAIFIAEKVLRQYENTPIYNRLKSVFTKISESLPEKITVDPSFLDHKFSFFKGPLPQISATVWEAVFSGLRTSSTIKISHAKPGARLTKRLIDPYHLVSYQGDWYVIAFCHARKDIRTFALSRINETEQTGPVFSIPADFDFKKTCRTRFGVQWSDREYKVKIWFSAQAAPYIQERKWHENQEIVDNDDRSILLTFSVSHLLEVKRWVLSWGKMARVLAPAELANEVREELAEALSRY
ncbi:MAG: WYL domain-containing protein [Desulfobulbaceae bacterium]|nr:WYL domain-containing protein [Desulfobulbaceae bacterium]